jgi:hypothetical protein
MKKGEIITKLEKLFFIFLFVLILLLGFAPKDFPDNLNFKDGLGSVFQGEVIVVFNSGGWGYTPIEEARDFSSILNGIQKTLEDLGCKSIVLPYNRTKKSFLGRVEGLREFLNSFQRQSKKLSEDIENFLENHPDNKIIITGLSNGGVFADKVMEKISKDKRDNVFAIEVGLPFWEESLNSENVLFLTDKDRDPLSERTPLFLIFSFIKAPFKWALARISGENISISDIFHFTGHEYFWDSPNIGPQIFSFLEDKFNPNF